MSPVSGSSGSVASAAVNASDMLFYMKTDAYNGAGVETDLFNPTIAAGQLANNGDILEIEFSGIFAATVATDKRIKLKFGSTVIFDSGTLAITTLSSWLLSATIIRVSTTTFRSVVQFSSSNSALVATVTYTAGTETLANALILDLTGNGTNQSDVVAKMGNIFYTSAGGGAVIEATQPTPP